METSAAASTARRACHFRGNFFGRFGHCFAAAIPILNFVNFLNHNKNSFKMNGRLGFEVFAERCDFVSGLCWWCCCSRDGF
ncbi:hypothetical protein Nepgr_023661 [Nepenthes gracilis]|uniref:Uncharacterized protein n=1 Tax=Nepenthes gracilis TaxID=150966 RepID=A0AAD3T2J3_NEPGR|nr:hypothetical protein Nepgr_023661 [Nepenthes gracilis]